MKIRVFSLIIMLALLLTGCGVDNSTLFTLQGKNQFSLGHPEQALLWYEQAIALDPDFAEAYYYRAAAYLLLEAHDKTIADLDRAIALRPEWAEAYLVRAVSYRLAGHSGQAYADFEKFLALNSDFLPTQYEQRIGMCVFWAVEEDTQIEALKDFEIEQVLEATTKAIEVDPDNVEAYFCRGNGYLVAGESEKAVADLDRVIELNPDDAVAYFQRALVYGQTVDMTAPDMSMKIKMDLDKAIELDPDFADPYWLRGTLQLYDTFGYPGAIQDFETYLALAPDVPAYAEARVQVEELLATTKSEYSSLLAASAENLRQRGRVDSAIVGFDEAIKLNPNNAEAYNGRAMAYFSLGNNEAALEDLNQAIELAPDEPRYYFNRGIAYDAMEQWNAAIADYDKAIELGPNDTDAYNGRGIAYAELGEDERAIEDFDRAIELDAENANPYLNRGKALLRAGEYDLAIADLDRAIALQPDWVTTYLYRGKAYGALGEYEQAIQDLEKYLASSAGAPDHAQVEELIATYKNK